MNIVYAQNYFALLFNAAGSRTCYKAV